MGARGLEHTSLPLLPWGSKAADTKSVALWHLRQHRATATPEWNIYLEPIYVEQLINMPYFTWWSCLQTWLPCSVEGRVQNMVLLSQQFCSSGLFVQTKGQKTFSWEFSYQLVHSIWECWILKMCFGHLNRKSFTSVENMWLFASLSGPHQCPSVKDDGRECGERNWNKVHSLHGCQTERSHSFCWKYEPKSNPSSFCLPPTESCLRAT